MKLHTLHNTPGARTSRKRVGRGPGSGIGRTSTKGHKGQMARKGHKHKLGFEGGQMRLVRRLPKYGFKNPTRQAFVPINLGQLDTPVVKLTVLAPRYPNVTQLPCRVVARVD